MALHDASESRFDHSLHIPVHKAVNRGDEHSLQVLQKDEECRKQRFAALRFVIQPDYNGQSKERQQRARGFDGLFEYFEVVAGGDAHLRHDNSHYIEQDQKTDYKHGELER
jgi:hypothetical protein